MERLRLENPGLKALEDEILATAYDRALIRAARQTGLGSSAFPEKCTWTWDRILDEQFMPSDQI